jgi:hypothetical protein
MSSGKTWENIGIGVAAATGLAAITAGVPMGRANRVEEPSYEEEEIAEPPPPEGFE